MTISKGGRGKKAPYETTHARVPKPLKPLIDKLTGRYRELVEKAQKTEDLVDSVASCIDNDKPVNNLSEQGMTKEDAINYAQKLLRGKKSKKETIEKLLTSIYGGDIDLEI